MRMDGEDFTAVRRMIEHTKRQENWLVLAGHSISDSSRWETNLAMFRELVAYAHDPANGVWLATVSQVASFVTAERVSQK